MMLFWFGFTCGVLALLLVAVIVRLRSEKAKRRTVTVTTHTPHGLRIGDQVIVDGRSVKITAIGASSFQYASGSPSPSQKAPIGIVPNSSKRSKGVH